MWKNNAAALGSEEEEAGGRGSAGSSSRPPLERDLQASLTFHGILLGSHDVDEGALQGVHVQAVVHSGALLKTHTGQKENTGVSPPFPLQGFLQIGRPGS